jgi:hypothetical protein
LILKRKDYQVRNELLKESNRVGSMCLPHAWFPELGQRLVQVQRGFLGPLVEEEFEELLVKLKLLLEGRLVQSLVNWEFLAEVKVDLPLLRLGFLLGQGEIEPLKGLKLLVELLGLSLVKLALLFEKGVTGSLIKTKSPLEQKMVQPLVNLRAEEERFPQGDSPIFLLQMPN